MSPESTSALSVSSGLHGGATVIRAVGDLDYDYAPVFRRQLTELWATAPIPDANTAHVTTAPAPDANTAHVATSPTPDTRTTHTTPPAPGAGASHITAQPHGAATPHVVNTAHAASTTHPTETIHAAGAVHLPETTHLPEATRPTETPHTTDTTHTADVNAPGISRLVIDLSGLTFCDSTGLAELLWVLQRSREAGTRLMLAGTNRTLRHMLTTTGLLSFFELADSVEEALERR
ncbi:STAS domain-containing protein [Streptosporangium saharense]|uniref:Anti-anti-sigma factor n=1 Tax=Streptosporangium saharense TaxID=1706840 RepID=A0A7W7QGZ6_9ACTN|nr:STAS domain-containing protein [Streptosporangium saharense]MBB4913405.1 anti-anti-sigma factor [Streptosporangium saharense]